MTDYSVAFFNVQVIFVGVFLGILAAWVTRWIAINMFFLFVFLVKRVSSFIKKKREEYRVSQYK